jgi:hypothetical protein
MSEKKELTIHKRNEVIRGGNTYSLSAQKLGNAIYHHIQLNRVFAEERFRLPVKHVREIMGLEHNNNYVEAIKKAVHELSMPITLYNTDQITGLRKKGRETLFQISQFLHDPIVEKDGKEIYIEAQMSPIMRVLIAESNEGNFTQLVLNTHLKEVKSKHSYILYEYVKSYEDFNVIGNKIELGVERLDRMFNMEHNRKYLYFSSFKPLLTRAVNDINKNTDMRLELSADKGIKKYYIHRLKNKENAEKKKTELDNKEKKTSSYWDSVR